MAWQESPTSMERTFVFRDFTEAFAFMTSVAAVAQEMDHHPDMTISWNKVTLRLTTHSAGSTVTDLDRALAARVDTIATE